MGALVSRWKRHVVPPASTSCVASVAHDTLVLPDNDGDGVVDGDSFAPLISEWRAEQLRLRDRLVLAPSNSIMHVRTVAGVDISYPKDPSNNLVAVSIAIVDIQTCELIDIETQILTIPPGAPPYVPGYLGFREVPLLKALVCKHNPDVVMVDGNGRLHPRGFGSACHLGVVCDVPTIGVAKKLHTFGDLPTEKELRQIMMASKQKRCALVSGDEAIGMAVIPPCNVIRPIYISAGHRMSLSIAVDITMLVCHHRVPEPIRFADMSSRDALRNLGLL